METDGPTNSMATSAPTSLNPETLRALKIQETTEADPSIIPEGVKRVKIPVMRPLTVDEAVELAADAGISVVRIRRMGTQSFLAGLLEEMGAQRVCVGDMLMSNQLRMEAIQKCRRAFQRAKTPQEVAGVAEAINKLLDSKDKTTHVLLKTLQEGSPLGGKAAVSPTLPPKGVQIVAQNVTVNADPQKPNG